MPTSTLTKPRCPLHTFRTNNFHPHLKLVPQSILKRTRIIRSIITARPINVHALLRKLQQRPCQLRCFFQRLPLRHHPISKSHRIRFPSIDSSTSKNHIQRSAQADDSSQAYSPAIDKRNSPATAENAKHSIFFDDSQIAQQAQFQTSGYGVAGDGGYHGFLWDQP